MCGDSRIPQLPIFPLYLDKQPPYFSVFDCKTDLNLCFVNTSHGELATCSGLMPSPNTSPSPFTCMKPLLSEPEGLPGMTSDPRPPMVETAAAAATAGATVGAVGDMEELGEKASLRV